MNQLSRICPVSDAEAARMVRPGTLADLAAQITATPAGPAWGQPGSPGPAPGRAGPRSPARRRWLIGVPLAAGLAITALIFTGLPGPAQRPEPGAAGPHAAQVLSFTTRGGFIDVIVRNPLADPGRYRAEFARHHLNITLKLLPVSPSIVGTVVFIGESSGAAGITPITARGKCYTGGGGSACPVGVRIPAGFRGQADLVFGRAARPGERYESTAPAFAPGEVMHGMRISGQRVARVLAELHRRHVTVPVFNYNNGSVGKLLRPGQVPGIWYVYDSDPWAPQQVMLFVGPTRTEPKAGPPQPGSPVPTPAPTAVPTPAPTGVPTPAPTN